MPTARHRRGRPRVLVAGSPSGVTLVQRLLGTVAAVEAASTVAEALAALRSGVDLLVCESDFDESRMLELLGLVRAEPALARVRVVCVRSRSVTGGPVLGHAVQVACRALGAVAFVDLVDATLRDAAEDELRRTLLRHLGARRPRR